MTDAERRPMQRMIATGSRFARKGHGRPQEGGRPEFSEQYAHAREAGIHTGIHAIGICIAVLVTGPVTTEKRNSCGCCVTVPVTLSFP